MIEVLASSEVVLVIPEQFVGMRSSLTQHLDATAAAASAAAASSAGASTPAASTAAATAAFPQLSAQSESPI